MKFVVLLLALSACARPPSSAGTLSADVPGTAPKTLEGLASFLYRNHENIDPAVAADGLTNLEQWLETFADGGKGISKNTALGGRSWTLKPLTDQDVATLPARPDRPLNKLLAGAVAFVSEEPIGCHAGVQAGAEQTPIESTAKTYVRNFTSTDDPHCFVDRSCDELDTKNDILRASLLFSADIELFKNYKWFDYDFAGTPRRAFYSRGWSETSADGSGGNKLWQSYSIDVWIDRGADVLRFQVLWSESDIYLAGAKVDDDTQLATVTTTTDGIFAATESYIEKTVKPAGRCQ
jgi:hypothetical protein